MAIELENVLPSEIEKRSFEIITEELTQSGIVLDPEKAPVIKRCIHTSADFDYAQNLVFSENAIARAKEAIRNGASIVTDTQMGRSGINKKRLAQYGGQVYCFMSDEDVAEKAKRDGTTRAVASMEKACELEENLIFAFFLAFLQRKNSKVTKKGAPAKKGAQSPSSRERGRRLSSRH